MSRVALRVNCRAVSETPESDEGKPLIAEGYRFDFEHEPTKDQGHYVSAVHELKQRVQAGESGNALMYLAVPDDLKMKFQVGDRCRLMRGFVTYATCQIVEIVSDAE